MDALRDARSVWSGNHAGLNVLLLRYSDLESNAEAALVAAVRTSSAARRGPTLVLLPPASAEAASEEPKSTAALRAIDGVMVVDSGRLHALLNAASSSTAWHSPFLDRFAHAPYSSGANSLLASLVCRALHRIALVPRKVYCLDADNTLWGGAVGELGPHGVVLSEAYLDLQRRFVARQARGALICLVSRNREEDVRAVLRERADELLLREEHIVAIRASWDIHKGEALNELSRSLCLDPASFVFVDDSPVECAEVHAACAHKGVSIVQLPRDESRIASYLDQCWALDEPPYMTSPTSEDAARTTLYRELDARKAFVATTAAVAASSSSSMDAFAASLNLQVDVKPLDSTSLRRAAQLTQRTHQHNACEHPLPEAALMRVSRSGRMCLTAEARDRFGQHGLVGLIVAEPQPAAVDAVGGEGGEGGVLHVRCWLLSCRSLHLGIEHRMLRHLAAIAKEAGATQLGVHWIKGERNEAAAAFFAALPGVEFVPMQDRGSLGLAPLECEQQQQHPPPLEAPPAAEAESLTDPPHALTDRTNLSIRCVLWSPKRSRSGEAVRVSIALKLVDPGGKSAAARAEAARLRDVVSLSVRRAHIPNKISNKMLLQVGTKATARPAQGIILIPVASAAGASLSFNPAGLQQAHAERECVTAGAEGKERAGFACAAGCALHYETVRELAETLADEPGRLHAWVGAQSERTHPLPDAFREVWAGGGAEDADTLNEKLKRRMRDAMEVAMEGGPE